MEDKMRWEPSILMNELLQGMEAARKLSADFRTESSVETRDLLVQRILSSYEKALLILKWNASNTDPLPIEGVSGLPPESPMCANVSPLRDDIDGDIKDHPEFKLDSKKRKMMPTWMEQVRSSSETALEGPHDDGFSWRKYGQKDILGAKYPRSYYRCTFRKTQNCWATKQIQRSDEDPTVFDITYRGRHTCSLGNNSVQPPKSPDKQEKLNNYESDIRHHEPLQESLVKFRNNLSVSTGNLQHDEMANPFTFLSTSSGYITPESHNLPPLALENDSFWGNLSQTDMLSPNTPQSYYLPSLSFKMDEFHGIKHQPCSESDITEIISANTSASNSPILDFNFPIDPAEIDPNFPFDTPGLFP
ncbi:probable WRKY transcription factor 41 [Prosopis cineraria]|uniref:probable WRKY transcription factor 41 n=1 Tax=Prosopis cineraria TaxID=364024 RepID=UPI00240F3BC4|nr:probable WRKY transcription factor 41 [Prosopis cineraria]